MPLSCTCPEGEDDADSWYWPPEDYSEMPHRKRRARCQSCKAFINSGTMVAYFRRTRCPKTDIEERIFGWDSAAVSLAPIFLCEECADLFFSLTELGFCVSPYENQKELVNEYAAMAKGRNQ